jgi:hypothetical protein
MKAKTIILVLLIMFLLTIGLDKVGLRLDEVLDVAAIVGAFLFMNFYIGILLLEDVFTKDRKGRIKVKNLLTLLIYLLFLMVLNYLLYINI